LKEIMCRTERGHFDPHGRRRTLFELDASALTVGRTAAGLIHRAQANEIPSIRPSEGLLVSGMEGGNDTT
jgi:hypothetical protein